MPNLREYVVDLGTHTATMLLSDEDALRYGAKASPKPEAKAATASNKAVAPAANKARG